MFAATFTERHRGFTLVELLIVIVVIAILALIVIPRLMTASDRARSATYTANLNQIVKGLEAFKNDTGVYPSCLEDLYAISTPTLTSATKGFPNYSPTNFHGPYLISATPINDTVPLPPNPYYANTASSRAEDNWKYTVASDGSGYTELDGGSSQLEPSSGF